MQTIQSDTATTNSNNIHQIEKLIARAMRDQDNQVVELKYTDSKGTVNRRVISPIRFVNSDRFMALCLCREAPRVFYLRNCSDVSIQPAWKYVMPVKMVAN